MRKTAFASLVFLSVGMTQASAAQESVNREALVNLTGVYVLIEGLPDDVAKAGLSVTQLQTDVELRLRQSGVRVLTTREERASVPGNPTLYVNVNAMEIAPKFYAFNAALELEQDVTLVRAPSVVLYSARTWSASSTLGTVSRGELADHVRQKVRDKTDEFINAYLATNPKR